MALIIKGDMPKACNWFDENGKHRFCKVNAFCDCEIYTRGEKPSDCPILGEIPDEHGRLIDAYAFKSNLIKARYSDNPNKEKTYNKALDILFDAPTVLGAGT